MKPPVVLSAAWMDLLPDALQKGQTFFHRPRHILQNCSKQKQEEEILCTLCGPPEVVKRPTLSVYRLFLGKFVFHFLRIKCIRKWQPETLLCVNSVVLCLIIIPPSCSNFSIKFKCQELNRFESHKHQTPLYMFLCINEAIKTQNFENWQH